MVNDFPRRNPHEKLRSTSNREAGHIQQLREEGRKKTEAWLAEGAAARAAQPADATPIPETAKRRRIMEPEDVVDPEIEPRPSIRAIRLQGRVNDMYHDLVLSHLEKDAKDMYADDLRDLEVITHGLIADPQNQHLISQLSELEHRYKGR